MSRNVLRNFQCGPREAVAAIALVALVASVAPAQLPTGGFSLKVGDKEMILANPNDPEWNHYLMWDLGYQRMIDRNMPALELTNDPTSTAPITQFHLTIGDERFHFSDAFMGSPAKLGKTTPGFDISSSTLDDLGNELILNIGGGGLQPGATIRFNIQIGVDDEFADEFFMYPDYRTVLFDMNGVNVYDGNVIDFSTDDNARAWAVFTPGTGPSFTSEQFVFEDELVVGPWAGFYNGNLRRYQETDPLMSFQVGGVTVIPEPSTALLAAMGLVGAAWLSRRIGRSTVAAA